MNNGTPPRPERYAKPKEIAAKLESEYGLSLTPKYISAVKKASIQQGDGLFAAGQAQPGAVLDWLKRHPGFRRDHGPAGFDFGKRA